MDFKVAGTKDVVTALQLDTKLDGIPASVLAAALKQARDARLAILDVMQEAIDSPAEMSPTAPRIITIKIPVDKIGEVIGPKGKMINQIQDDTGAEITIEDDGTIYIGATDGPSAEAARSAINAIANPHHAGGRRALPGHGRQDRRLRRVRLACCPARTACCTSPRSASCTAASASRTSRTSSASARRSRSRSPRSTRAASCSWSRSRSWRRRAADKAARAESGEPEPVAAQADSDDDSVTTAASPAAAAPAAVRTGRPQLVITTTLYPDRTVRGHPPHRPARWAARGDRDHADRALASRSASGSASAPVTRTPSAPARPTSWSTCCSRAPPRATRMEISAAIEARRRRDQRVHRQGVHLLLRAGPRRPTCRWRSTCWPTWSPRP